MAAMLVLVFSFQDLQAQDSTDIRQQYSFLGDFTLEGGQTINDCRIGYRTYGSLNADKSNAIIFPTWFGGTTRQLEEQIPGMMIDTTKFYLILIDALGNGISSSPSNSIKQPRLQFPSFTIRDMVESQYKLLTEKMNIHHLVAVVGISLGGFQSFQWAISHPDFMDKVIPIVGSPKLTSYDLLWGNTMLMALRSDTAYHDGNYEGKPALNLVSLISQLQSSTPEYVVTHISTENFYTWLASIEDQKNIDWNDFRWQLDAALAQDITATVGGTLEDAAKKIKAKMLIITSKQDHTVNPIPATRFAKLVNARLLELESDCGHMVNSCESEKVNSAVHDFLNATL